MPVKEHRKESEGLEVKLCLIVTGDSIYKGIKKDEITQHAGKLVDEFKLKLIKSTIVPNDAEQITEALDNCLKECDVCLITGGTGISRRDISVDIVKKVCVKELPGFGEIFRHLTYVRYGSAAMLSRAYACVVNDRLVFVVPGSPDAVDLALKEIILPEVRHAVFELRK